MRKTWSQLIFRRPAVPGWSSLLAGGRARGWEFRLTHDHDGFALESAAGPHLWRLEWGPSQRHYLGSHELRLRGETGIDPMTHAVLMPRSLMAALEHEIYQQFTEGVMTRLDDQTPEEVRWLAMSERLKAPEMGALNAQFAAVSNAADWMADWLRSGVSPALMAWAGAAIGDAEAAPPPASTLVPMSLVMRRGQLVLRLGMPRPDLALVTAAVDLYEVALAEARRWGDASPA